MITRLIETAARRFGLSRNAVLVRPVMQAESIESVNESFSLQVHLAPCRAQEHHAMHFTSSPLARAGLSAAQIDAVDVAFSHPDVQRAAGRLAATRQRLAEAGGLRRAIAEAIDSTGAADPISLIEALDRSASEAEDAIAAVREDKQRHDAQHKARMVRLQPLRSAVGRRITELNQERESLVRRAEAAGSSRMLGDMGSLKYVNLRASGLTDAQITSLGPDCTNPVEAVRAMQQRIAEIDDALVPLWSFAKDEYFDAAPLVGLGFDDEIEARSAAEQALA